MARQLITFCTNNRRDDVCTLLNKYLIKNNYKNSELNGEAVIIKKNTLGFLNRFYLKIHINSRFTVIEGWFNAGGKDYCLDDGIMYSEKHRALSQSIEALASLINGVSTDIINGNTDNTMLPDGCEEFMIVK